MGLVVKFIIKSIFEKKVRTSLIILAITLSSALILVSTAVSETMIKMNIEMLTKQSGNAQIIIQPDSKSKMSFFNTNRLHPYEKHFQYVVGGINDVGTYKSKLDETVYFSLRGMHLEDLKLVFSLLIDEANQLYPFERNKLVIGKNIAQKYALSLGEVIDIKINGKVHKFSIAGISHPVGLFQDDGQTAYAIVPRETLGGFYGIRGSVNTIYLKLKDSTEKDILIEKLSEEYSRCTVKEPFSKKEIDRQANETALQLLMLTIVISFMSMFIIFSSFNVLTSERLPVIGTLRSVGATKRMTSKLLLLESTSYGIIGGILGVVLGIVILFAISVQYTPPWVKGFKMSIDIKFMQIMVAFGWAVGLSFISSLIPILRVSNMALKNIFLNSIEKPFTFKIRRLITGVIFLSTAALPPFIPPFLAKYIDMLCITLIITAAVLLTPYITSMFTGIFERVYVYVFGNIGILAAKNLKKNKSLWNSITLLSVGISTVLMVNTVTNSAIMDVMNLFSNYYTCDIIMTAPETNRSFERLLYQVDGVEEVHGTYTFSNAEIIGKNDEMRLIQGVEKSKILEFRNFDIDGNQELIMEQLDSGRNVLLATAMKDKFGFNIGDTISFRFNDKVRDFKVIGFFNSIMNKGYFALVSERYLKQDANLKYYSELYIKTNKDPEVVANNIRKEFQRKNPVVKTIAEQGELTRKNGEQKIIIFQGFSVMTMLIGILGVLNNLIISFLERKRVLSILRSIGMSKMHIVKMIFIESFSGGIIAGTMGVTTGLLLISVLPYLMKAINRPYPLYLFPYLFFGAFLAGVLINICASISPAIKSSKLNIIETIKFE
ncbi:MAG: ABC transporter permease [Bacillota bacterium]